MYYIAQNVLRLIRIWIRYTGIPSFFFFLTAYQIYRKYWIYRTYRIIEKPIVSINFEYTETGIPNTDKPTWEKIPSTLDRII